MAGFGAAGLDRQYATARRFSRPPPLLRWCQAQGLLGMPGEALVFGAGLLVEANALVALGWRVDALELPGSVAARPWLYEGLASVRTARVLTSLAQGRRWYDLVTVTHVMELSQIQ